MRPQPSTNHPRPTQTTKIGLNLSIPLSTLDSSSSKTTRRYVKLEDSMTQCSNKKLINEFLHLLQTHCLFIDPWQILTAGRSRKSKKNWYASEAEINYKIKQRSVLTIDGKSPFRYFDGATMMEYRFPSKATEVVFCRNDPVPEGCEGDIELDLNRQNTPNTPFVFNPALSRKQHFFQSDASTRGDISEGEELLDSYLSSSGSSLHSWKDEVLRLRQQV